MSHKATILAVLAILAVAPLAAAGSLATLPDHPVKTQVKHDPVPRGVATDGAGVDFAVSTLGLDFIDLSGNADAGITCDDCHVLVPMGFAFPFGGTDYTDAAIGSNGNIVLGAVPDVETWSPNEIPNQDEGTVPVIAPFWGDFEFDCGGAGSVHYATFGLAPHRVFVVEWLHAEHFECHGDDSTFEAKLFETSGIIQFHYLHADNAFGDAGRATAVGAEDGATVTGTQVAYGTGGDLSFDTLAYELTPTDLMVPTPELPTVALASVGLLAIGAVVVIGRRR